MTNGYSSDSIIRGAWNKMQQSFHCCGNRNYSDWFNVTWDQHLSPPNRTIVPESCCKDMRKDCNSYEHVHNNTDMVGKFIYTEGCYDLITQFFRQKFSVLASAALSIAVIQ
ncbi:CD63 antigen, partial [Paramuricea clavata]